MTDFDRAAIENLVRTIFDARVQRVWFSESEMPEIVTLHLRMLSRHNDRRDVAYLVDEIHRVLPDWTCVDQFMATMNTETYIKLQFRKRKYAARLGMG